MMMTEIDGSAALSPAEVVRRIKASIRQANIGEGREDLVVTGIGLTLSTVLVKGVGSEFKWKIPFIGMETSGGAKITKSDTSSLSIDLVPPVWEGEGGALDVDADVLEDHIVYGVHDLRNAIAEAALDPPEFILKEAGVVIEFVATGEGKLSLIVVGESKEEVTHTMKLTLGRKSALMEAQKHA